MSNEYQKIITSYNGNTSIVVDTIWDKFDSPDDMYDLCEMHICRCRDFRPAKANVVELTKEYIKELKEKYGDENVFNLYMYSHSGVCLSLSPFNDRWDSGQIGFIVFDGDKYREYHPNDSFEKFREQYVSKYVRSWNHYMNEPDYEPYVRRKRDLFDKDGNLVSNDWVSIDEINDNCGSWFEDEDSCLENVFLEIYDKYGKNEDFLSKEYINFIHTYWKKDEHDDNLYHSLDNLYNVRVTEEKNNKGETIYRYVLKTQSGEDIKEDTRYYKDDALHYAAIAKNKHFGNILLNSEFKEIKVSIQDLFLEYDKVKLLNSSKEEFQTALTYVASKKIIKYIKDLHEKGEIIDYASLGNWYKDVVPNFFKDVDIKLINDIKDSKSLSEEFEYFCDSLLD